MEMYKPSHVYYFLTEIQTISYFNYFTQFTFTHLHTLHTPILVDLTCWLIL